MLSSQASLFYVFISAFIIENLVFARATGVDGIINHTRSNRHILEYGITLLAISLPAVALTWSTQMLFKDMAVWSRYKGIFAILCLTVSFFAVRGLLGATEYGKKLNVTDDTLILAAFNCSALGAVLLSLAATRGLLPSLIYCMGCVLGLTVAMFLVHSGRERLEISGVSRSFQGLPITLIYMGILSLAIYGLIGHQLPT